MNIGDPSKSHYGGTCGLYKKLCHYTSQGFTFSNDRCDVVQDLCSQRIGKVG